VQQPDVGQRFVTLPVALDQLMLAQVERSVADRGEEICPQAAFDVESEPAGPDAREDVLNEVLGGGAIVQVASGEATERSVVLAKKDFQGDRIAIADAPREIWGGGREPGRLPHRSGDPGRSASRHRAGMSYRPPARDSAPRDPYHLPTSHHPRTAGQTQTADARRAAIGEATMIESLGQIALTVRDVERSVAFYRDVIGLRFLFAPAPTLAFLTIGDVRLMLSAPEGAFVPGGGTVLYLRVADIEAEHAAMTTRGATFIDTPHLVARMPDHELWMCFLKDPDDHTLALMCEKR
jgi:methylmalonyl-CoA/ethylmalonyl-CoA epimerase